LEAYLACALGVVLSVIMPILASAVRRAFPPPLTAQQLKESGGSSITSFGLAGLFVVLLSAAFWKSLATAAFWQGLARGLESSIKTAWPLARPYIVLGLFSLAVALLLVATLRGTLTRWEEWLIAGYLWDSTLQKIAQPYSQAPARKKEANSHQELMERLRIELAEQDKKSVPQKGEQTERAEEQSLTQPKTTEPPDKSA
jgi:hypothetical protein